MSDANIKIVQDAYAAFGSGDVPTLLGLMADDVRWEMVGRPSDFANFGVRNGPAEVGEFFRLVGELEEFDLFEPRVFDAGGDKVVVQGRAEGRLRATGKPVCTDWLHLFTIQGGKITGFREFLDTAQYVEAGRA